ncbi:MAG: hypothetical protein WKF96_22020, partial [Solirubrobacteraceae bacterium]
RPSRVTTTMVVTAHAGHLALELLQFVPLIAVAAVVVWRTWTGRRAAAAVREGQSTHAYVGIEGGWPAGPATIGHSGGSGAAVRRG